MPRGYTHRVPKEKRGRLNGPIRSASPVVRALLEIVLEQGNSYRKVANKAGFGQNAIGRWRKGLGAPSIITLECLAKSLGYKIIVVKDREE